MLAEEALQLMQVGLILMELLVQTGMFRLQQMENLLQLTDSLQEKLQRQKEDLGTLKYRGINLWLNREME